MKVLCITNALTISTTFIYHQISQMRLQNIDVKILVSEDNSKGSYTLNPDILPKPYKIESVLNILSNKFIYTAKYFNLKYYSVLKRTLNTFNPDLILIHFGTELVKLFTTLKQYNVPVVTVFHGFDASKYLRYFNYRRQLRKIFNDKKFFASCVAYDMISRFNVLGINARRFYHFHLGINTDYFVKENASKLNENFLQISNFVKKKGHSNTILAFHRYINKYNDVSTKLVFAGGGPTLNHMKKLVSDLNITEQVTFLGAVNIREVKKILNEYNYFVHPSITDDEGDQEGIPTVLMEAMSMNLRVISTYHSGIPELVQKSSGILVNENDIESLADAFFEIKRLDNCPRKIIIDEYNLRNNTQQFIDFLKKIKDSKINVA